MGLLFVEDANLNLAAYARREDLPRDDELKTKPFEVNI